MLDADEINALVDLMEARGLAEVEIEADGRRLRVARTLAAQPAAAGLSMPESMPDSMPESMPAPAPAAAPAAVDGHPVKAPMTGMFYRAPGPDEPAFVEPGQQVAPGDVLCIIESMKMMHRIEADRAGVVQAVAVDNASPVDAGQTLLLIG